MEEKAISDGVSRIMKRKEDKEYKENVKGLSN